MTLFNDLLHYFYRLLARSVYAPLLFTVTATFAMAAAGISIFVADDIAFRFGNIALFVLFAMVGITAIANVDRTLAAWSEHVEIGNRGKETALILAWFQFVGVGVETAVYASMGSGSILATALDAFVDGSFILFTLGMLYFTYTARNKCRYKLTDTYSNRIL